VRDVATSVLSQHFKKGYHTHTGNAIGFGQGGASVAAPILLRQVQNSATHGMAGTFITATWIGCFLLSSLEFNYSFLVDITLPNCYTYFE